MLQLCVEFHLLHLKSTCYSSLINVRLSYLYRAWEEHIHELTVSSTTTQLLYLGKLRLQAVVHPGEHLGTGQYHLRIEG